MKAKPALFCLLILFVFLAACQSRFIPGAPAPSAAPETQAPTAAPETPAAESQPSNSPISLAEYYAMVSAFNAKLMGESEILIQTGLYEYNWWASHAGESGEIDFEEMFHEMLEWLSEDLDSTLDTIAAARYDLSADYLAILSAEVDGQIPAELSERVSLFFSAYYKLYDVVTEPSEQPLRDFVPMLCSCTHSILTSNAELTSTLDRRPA